MNSISTQFDECGTRPGLAALLPQRGDDRPNAAQTPHAGVDLFVRGPANSSAVNSLTPKPRSLAFPPTRQTVQLEAQGFRVVAAAGGGTSAVLRDAMARYGTLLFVGNQVRDDRASSMATATGGAPVSSNGSTQGPSMEPGRRHIPSKHSAGRDGEWMDPSANNVNAVPLRQAGVAEVARLAALLVGRAGRSRNMFCFTPALSVGELGSCAGGPRA